MRHEDWPPKPWSLALGLGLAVAIVAGGEWWLHRPTREGIDPPLATATAPQADIGFSNDAPERHGTAVRLADADTVAMDRALFKLRLPFKANRIAILGRDDAVADEVERPVRGQVYRWDVQPGSFSYEVDRVGFSPDIEPIALGPGGKRFIVVPERPALAPTP